MDSNGHIQAIPPTAEPRPRPLWATVMGWACIALAALEPAAIVVFAEWVLWGDDKSAVAWAVGLIAGGTMPVGAGFLSAYVLYPLLIAMWGLLLDGGISLLRRDRRAECMLVIYGGIVAAANIPLSLVGPFTAGTFSPSLLVGALWPLFVLVWMLRPSIRKEIASWKPAPPPRPKDSLRDGDAAKG